jgi:hypothetical protein
VTGIFWILSALCWKRAHEAAPPKFGKDVLKCAEQLDGLHFTEAEEELAAASVSRNLDSYEERRKLAVPLDTECSARKMRAARSEGELVEVLLQRRAG